MNAAELTAALRGKWNAETGQGSARCPAHEDRHPSLSIGEGDGGQVLVHCHTGCAQEAVIAALEARGLWERLEPLELVVPRNGTNGAVATPTPIRREVATYDYRDDCGALLYQTVRYVPKDFRQRRPVEGGWEWNLKGVPWVLYRFPELLSTPKTTPVLLTEGEKDVDRLRDLGLTATCNPLGAKKWRPEYTAALKGRTCIILPDADPSGAEHAGIVAQALLGTAASVKVVQLPELPLKGDVSDWLDAGHDRAELEHLMAETEAFPNPEPRYPLQTLAELVLRREDRGAQVVDGMLWAGRVHWVFSDPNTGKTLFLVAALLHVAAGRPFCGRAVQQGPVLIIEEDSPLSVLAEYVETLAEIYGFDLATLPIWCNRVQGLRITDDDGLTVAREAIAACPEPPIVVLFDACERLVPSDKFNTKELDAFTRLCQGLTTAGQVPVVIDHTNRARSDGKKEVKPMERLFGARAKSAISDAMLYFDGRLSDGPVEVQFAKFRGEAQTAFSIVFDPSEGFQITDRPTRARAQAEGKVLGFFRTHPGQWVSQGQVTEATDLPRRTVQRWLTALTEQRWLIREDGDHGDHTQYQLNPSLPKAFE